LESLAVVVDVFNERAITIQWALLPQRNVVLDHPQL
jgi:hypothetical protein